MGHSLEMLLLVFFVIFVSTAHGEDKSEADLKRYLLENYDTQVRPVRKTTDTIPVRITLSPLWINDVDVKDLEVKFDSWILIRWEDAFLTWDQAEYGVTQLVLPHDTVWKPDISLYTAASKSYFFPNEQTNVVIYNNGTVLWVPPFTIKSKCLPTENQVTEDTFKCILKLGSWTYHVGLLDIQEFVTDPLHYAIQEGSFFNINPKWILESMTASSEAKKYECCEELYSLVSYDMRFRKRPRPEE